MKGSETEEQIQEIIAPTLLYCGWFFYSIIVPRAVKLPKEEQWVSQEKQKEKRKKKLPRDAATYKTVTPARLRIALNAIDYWFYQT